MKHQFIEEVEVLNLYDLVTHVEEGKYAKELWATEFKDYLKDFDSETPFDASWENFVEYELGEDVYDNIEKLCTFYLFKVQGIRNTSISIQWDSKRDRYVISYYEVIPETIDEVTDLVRAFLKNYETGEEFAEEVTEQILKATEEK